MEKVQLSNGRVEWAINCIEYLKGAISNVNNLLKENKSSLKVYGDSKRLYPFLYHLEMDVTSELITKLINRFQQFIGVLRWAIELGRVDILTQISFLS